jgi:hypothetical protein
MSLISLAAPLIRLAAADESYEQELFDAVYPKRDPEGDSERDPEGDSEALIGLVHSGVRRQELAALTSTEWQWYANWRQALGGRLDPVVLKYLTDSASTRFARFEVHKLVLRDPETNELAPTADDPSASDRPDAIDAIGLNWLSEQARGKLVEEEFQRRRDEGEEQLTPAEAFESVRDEALIEVFELMRDALQCATDASWFLLRRLTSLNDDRARLVTEELQAFARDRRIDSRMTQRWGLN